MRQTLANLAGQTIAAAARLATAVREEWRGSEPVPDPRVYFANHSSHGDFVLIWTVLPPRLRRLARPVAAADYWLRSAFRRFLIRDVFNAVLIERDPERRCHDPIVQMSDALDAGQSLILFPEGTRNTGHDQLLPFKSGLYHLAKARPAVELVPVWIGNLGRVMPKGEILPVPIACSVTFGSAITLTPEETKDAFLARATMALEAVRPTNGTAE